MSKWLIDDHFVVSLYNIFNAINMSFTPTVTPVYVMVLCTGQIAQIMHDAPQPSHPLWPLYMSWCHVPDRLPR